MEQIIDYTELQGKFKEQCIDVPYLVVNEVYDLGIKACDEKDTLKARNVFKTLIGFLNFEYEEPALGLYKLYDHCQRLLDTGNFDGAKQILKELSASWNKAIETNLSDNEKEEINDPGAAISAIYKRGIKACEEKDSIKITKILKILMKSLDFQYQEVASGFYRLYDYCARLVNENKYDEAKEILVELNQCWNKAVVASLNDVNEAAAV